MRYYQRAQSAEGVSYWQRALAQRIPVPAQEYVSLLMSRFDLELHLSAPRVSKLGHFRPAHAGRPQSISINRDLSTERFLLTLVHELAHLICHKEYGRRIKPHGAEWKRCFQQLMTPLLCEEVFSSGILPQVIRHLNAPKATSCVDKELHRAFERLEGKEYITLDEIPEGSRFSIRKDRQFIKGAKRRTRYLCEEVTSGRAYLIHGAAPVELAVEKPLFSPT